MKFKLDKALSLVAVGVIGTLQGAHAASVYEIKNLDDIYLQQDSESAALIGTLSGNRSGYGMAINADGESLGIAKGKKYLSVSEDDDGVIDIEDGIAPEETIIFSIDTSIIANNFTFTSDKNDQTSTPWLPTFISINGTTNPSLTDEDDSDTINSVDAYFFGINDSGTKVGSMSSEELTEPYEGTNEDQEFWYYRDFEKRGFVINADGVETALIPPFTEYVNDDGIVNIGGYSVAVKVNSTGLVVGYAGTELSSNSEDYLDDCIENDTYPLDICVQSLQFPYDDYDNSYIDYQIRGYVWQLNTANTAVISEAELPLGLTPDDDYTYIYTAQALGVNSEGTVVGRSYVYRDDDEDELAYDAAYWTKNSDNEYEYNWVEMIDDRYESIAYDINDHGILVGSYKQYLEGYTRDKFFYFDTNGTEDIVTPHDFSSSTTISDLSSKPKDINNKGQVVGYIETTFDKEIARPKAGFLYDLDTDEFSNLNELLTCESKGFEEVEGKWERRQVSIQDGTGKILTYNEDLLIVEANSINEDGIIVGTVSVRKPEYEFDLYGDLVIGDNGLPIFEVDGFGNPLTSYLPRMVVLEPIDIEVSDAWLSENDCVDDDDDDADYERLGAASFGWLFTLPLLWVRRRNLKK
ncbi:MAG: DUF3466 family protein [Shewanella sp.]